MFKKKSIPDLWLLILILFLLSFGLIVVFSTGFNDALIGGNSHIKFGQQAKWAGLSLLLMLITIYIPINWFYKFSFYIYILGLILLGLVFVPGIGMELLGAYRWIEVGSLTFMPSELMKIGVVLLLSALFTKNKGQLKGFRPILLSLLVVLIPALLIFAQPDLGTMLLVLGTGGIMIVLAGLPWLITILFALAGVGGLALVVSKKSYRLDRLSIYRNPWADPDDTGYQIIHSLYAIVNGGLTGVGPGNSLMKYGYLPEAMSDFIFSIIAEEFGILGIFVLILAYFLFLWRCFYLARKTEDVFSSFLVLGLSISICLQSLINIGVATATIPATGVTLPFISAGGTSLAISMISVGLILNVSRLVQLNQN